MIKLLSFSYSPSVSRMRTFQPHKNAITSLISISCWENVLKANVPIKQFHMWHSDNKKLFTCSFAPFFKCWKKPSLALIHELQLIIQPHKCNLYVACSPNPAPLGWSWVWTASKPVMVWIQTFQTQISLSRLKPKCFFFKSTFIIIFHHI